MTRFGLCNFSLPTFALFFLSLVACAVAQKPPPPWTSTPFDPPAIPLMVRSPFSTIWLANGNGTALYEGWPSHWNGKKTGMSSSVRVDGASYRIIGEDNSRIQPARQTSMQFTATSTIFTFRCGAVDFTYTFVSPADPSDLVRFSFPWSYLIVTASSNDGAAHKVEVYGDVSGEMINEELDTPIQWKTRMVGAQEGNDDALVTHQFWQTTGTNCTQTENNRIQDGTMYISTFDHPGLTYATVSSTRAREQFWDTGKLDNLLDKTFRTVSSSWPVFSFAHDLGSVLGASRPVIFGMGQARENLVQYATGANGQSQYRAPFYLTQFGSTEAAMDFFMRDHAHAMSVASVMDAQVEADGKGVSDNYAGLLQLAFRQAVAGLELTVGRTSSGAVDANDVMMFVAEIGTGGRIRVNVVDQIYFMMPFLLYLNPELLKYALRPTLQYHKAGLAGSRYCVHNIGEKYPQATGTGGDIEMPVGASAEMILLVAAHLQRTGDKSIVNEYYDILGQFADYLVNSTLNPASQATISETSMVEAAAGSANLAVQGILALRAMADISSAHGDTGGQNKYQSTAQEFISEWQKLAMSSDGKHLVFQYGDDKTYMMMHNMYPDRLLGFNLIPQDIYTTQEAWYEEKSSDYGPVILYKRGWTLTGPSLWAAATMEKPTMRNHFIDSTVKQLQSGLTSVPMPDQFDAHLLSRYDGLRARPQVGSYFSLLALRNKRIDVQSASIDNSAPDVSDDPKDAARSLQSWTSNLFIIAFTLVAWISVV